VSLAVPSSCCRVGPSTSMAAAIAASSPAPLVVPGCGPWSLLCRLHGVRDRTCIIGISNLMAPLPGGVLALGWAAPAVLCPAEPRKCGVDSRTHGPFNPAPSSRVELCAVAGPDQLGGCIWNRI
jgi:hypothetical protein